MKEFQVITIKLFEQCIFKTLKKGYFVRGFTVIKFLASTAFKVALLLKKSKIHKLKL